MRYICRTKCEKVEGGGRSATAGNALGVQIRAGEISNTTKVKIALFFSFSFFVIYLAKKKIYIEAYCNWLR